MTNIVASASTPSDKPSSQPSNFVLEVRDLQKRFTGRRDPALDEVSFTMGRGQILGLIGQNGAGKTTLLKIIATLISPTKGDVLVTGTSVCKDPQGVRRLIGYMPDDFGLYEE